MKMIAIVAMLCLMACGGTLTDEQRKAMKEQMELHKIRRVTDAEITEAGFAQGRQLVSNEKTANTGRAKLHTDSTTISNEIERQVFLAYSSASTSTSDNLQKIRKADGTDSDSLLYTQPLFNDKQLFEGMWSVWLSRKELILSLPKKKK